jgi:hypothetical protein
MIMNVRTFRGANCDSDHFMVVATYKGRIANARSGKHPSTPKLNCDALKTEQGLNMYHTALTAHLPNEISGENSQESIEMDWTNIKNAILKSAESSIGNKPTRNRNPWFDEECVRSIEVKNELRKQY